jgi:hypothetical protein
MKLAIENIFIHHCRRRHRYHSSLFLKNIPKGRIKIYESREVVGVGGAGMRLGYRRSVFLFFVNFFCACHRL